MEVKSLFEPAVKQETIARINKLNVDSKPLWGKMNVAQMLSHLQRPIGVADGSFQLKAMWFFAMIGPLFKSMLYNDKPYKKSLATSPQFITSHTDFEFEEEKRKLIEQIERFNESSIVNNKHPFFGRITTPNWGKAIWKHVDHHLKQFGI